MKNMAIQSLLVEDYKKDLIGQLVKIKQGEISSESKSEIDDSIKNIEDIGLGTFLDLRIMIWIVFLIGIVLIVLSIWNFIVDTSGSFAFLGMGGLGVADVLLTLFYNPMNRLQKASSDVSQQIMAQLSYNFIRKLRRLAIDNPSQSQQINDIADAHMKDLKEILRLLKEHLEVRETIKPD